eukprot:1427773-Lingulodinium_polyedra.AAC.1
MLLRHLMLDHVDALLNTVEAHRWTRPIRPPVRLTAAVLPANARPGANPWEVELRLAKPHTQQDRYWVAWARGEVTPAVVNHDIGRRLKTVVKTCETIAHNTATGKSKPSVLVRALPGCVPAMAA